MTLFKSVAGRIWLTAYGVFLAVGAVWFFYVVALMVASMLIQVGGGDALSTSDILELSNPLRLFH